MFQSDGVGGFSIPQPTQKRNSTHFVAQGRVCLFELSPNLAIHQSETYNQSANTNTNLIPHVDIENLANLLFGPDSCKSTYECVVTSLVMLSPIPLVFGDQMSRESISGWSADGDSPFVSQQISYSPHEIGKVLDILIRWLSEDPWTSRSDDNFGFSCKREVFVICGGSRINFSSVIRCEDYHAATGVASSSDQLCIKQLYCSSFIGVAADLDGCDSGDSSEESLVEGSFVVTAFGRTRKYTVTPIRTSSAAQVGVVTIAAKIQEASAGLDEEMVTPASCFHLGLYDLKADMKALGHDSLPDSVLAVWKMAQDYIDRSSMLLSGGKRTTPVDNSDVCDVISAATLKVFRFITKSGLLTECHDRFRKGHFGSVQREEDVANNPLVRNDTGGVSEPAMGALGPSQGELLVKITSYILARIPPAMKRIFPGNPSGVVARLVWSQFAAEPSDGKALRKAFHQIGASVRRDDLLYASLCRDYSVFSGLCFNSLFALSLFSHCSLALGLNDGW